MLYVIFNDSAYQCYDDGHCFLFSSDNVHEDMFRYITQDLSHLPKLFSNYISQRMNTSTFMLYDYSDNNTSLEQMKNTLIAAHPYYKHEVKEVLIKAIGNYFNSLLLYSVFHRNMDISGFSEEWYITRITALLAPLLALGDTYPKDFFNEYQKRVGENVYTGGQPDSEIEIAIYDIPQKMPTGLENEIRTQREIYNMLYFLLDISAQELDELTTPQRVWLYSNIIMNNRTGMSIPRQIFPKHPSYRPNQDYSQATEYNCELDDRFRPLHTLEKMNVGCDGIPAGMEKDFHTAIEYAKSVTAPQLYETYRISSLYQLLCLEVWSMIRSKTKIRKCKHCGRYFVAATRRIIYCDRVDESGMRCSAVGYQQSFQKRLEEDEPLQVYNRAYKTHHARLRKGTMSKDAFQLWCDTARLKLTDVKNGNLDIVSFRQWLKK